MRACVCLCVRVRACVCACVCVGWSIGCFYFYLSTSLLPFLLRCLTVGPSVGRSRASDRGYWPGAEPNRWLAVVVVVVVLLACDFGRYAVVSAIAVCTAESPLISTGSDHVRSLVMAADFSTNYCCNDNDDNNNNASNDNNYYYYYNNYYCCCDLCNNENDSASQRRLRAKFS